MERDKCFSSLLYSICKGLNYFFSSESQKKICPMVGKKPYLSPLLRYGHLVMTLELRLRMGKFSLLSQAAQQEKNVEISAIMSVFQGVWVICAKSPFVLSLDVPIKMFANSLAILNQQTRVHCFQTQLTEKRSTHLCLFVYFETEIFILISDEGLKISKEKKWIQI